MNIVVRFFSINKQEIRLALRKEHDKSLTATDLWIYSKLCWTRFLSHINFARSTLEMELLLAGVLKIFGVENQYIFLTLGATLILMLTGFYAGHWDLMHGLMEKETSLNNYFNPELSKLVDAQTAQKEE